MARGEWKYSATHSYKKGNVTQHWGAFVNQCCRVKAMSITYSEYVFVALGIQHAMRMRHIVICGLYDFYSIFLHYLTKGTIFEKKKVA